MIERWLGEVSIRLRQSGALAATFLLADEDCEQNGWIYPGCVKYRQETIERLGRKADFSEILLLDWKHPRQSWFLFAKSRFDTSWFSNESLSWNTLIEMQQKLRRQKSKPT
jgi:hypothetical protein